LHAANAVFAISAATLGLLHLRTTFQWNPEEDLELYDIVVYKRDDMYIIHRIVGIEEPNEKHPNERYFLLQGDAVGSSDPFPVLYSQMQGIYKGERIPYVGSFIMFLQSPAGWLCMLLVVFVMIVTPIVERILDREKRARLGSSSYIYATTGVGRQKTEPDGAQKEIIKLAGSQVSREVEIISVGKVGGEKSPVWKVDFKTYDVSPQNRNEHTGEMILTTRYCTASITAIFVPERMFIAKRLINPLGFTVLDYRQLREKQEVN
jgi:hypothetical protein